MRYIRLCKTLDTRGALHELGSNLADIIRDPQVDWYQSLFYYDEMQYKQFLQTRSIKGIKDVVGDKLLFDFDNKADPDAARIEAIKVYERLQQAGIGIDDIEVHFSGNKGFNLGVNLDRCLSPQEMKRLAFKYAKGTAFDPSIYDAPQIIRVAGTRHQETGLYKIPLSAEAFLEWPLDRIKDAAKAPRPVGWTPEPSSNRWRMVTPRNEFYEVPVEAKPAPVANIVVTDSLDYSKKPKFLTNCRWRLQNGYFVEGERNSAFLCLAATYKNVGFTVEHVYRLLKGVAELQSKRNNSPRYSDQELWNNVCSVVYADGWHNGQFTCKTEGWLQTYCNSDPVHCCKKETKITAPHTMLEIVPSFKEYVNNIDQNTVTLGLPTLDKSLFVSTGCNMGIIGAAASGKSALGLSILNHTSKNQVNSVFASLDMHRNRMFEKVMYKLTGKPRKELYEMFQRNEEGPWIDKLKQEFGNVFFFNQSCPSVQDVRDYVLDCQDQRGEKIKLVMLDYFERVTSEFSDDTQASKKVAGALQDMVNDLDIALITLVQPNKAALMGGADMPIYDYTKIKGSSFVYQAFRIIMSIWRPFYHPKDFRNDNYMQMAILKNDLGELGEFAFGWNGPRGAITELEQHQHIELEEMLARKADALGNKNSNTNGWGL